MAKCLGTKTCSNFIEIFDIIWRNEDRRFFFFFFFDLQIRDRPQVFRESWYEIKLSCSSRKNRRGNFFPLALRFSNCDPNFNRWRISLISNSFVVIEISTKTSWRIEDNTRTRKHLNICRRRYDHIDDKHNNSRRRRRKRFWHNDDKYVERRKRRWNQVNRFYARLDFLFLDRDTICSNHRSIINEIQQFVTLPSFVLFFVWSMFVSRVEIKEEKKDFQIIHSVLRWTNRINGIN